MLRTEDDLTVTFACSFCRTDDPETCLTSVTVLDHAVFPLPNCTEEGSYTLSEGIEYHKPNYFYAVADSEIILRGAPHPVMLQ